VIGIPDPKWDEHPRAEVVLRDGLGEVTARELSRHLHAVIETGIIHKRAVLTEIVLVPSIPKTSVGKIDKKRMRAALQAAGG
jgi:fatty-acyl-CoA synthase